MLSGGGQSNVYNNITSKMLTVIAGKLRRLCSRLRWQAWRRPRAKVVIRTFGKMYFRGNPRRDSSGSGGTRERKGSKGSFRGYIIAGKPIRIATFNAAMFSLAPAVPRAFEDEDDKYFSFQSPIAYGVSPRSDRPRGILKQSPLSSTMNSPESVSRKPRKEMKVRINLPDNEISLAQGKLLSFMDSDKDESSSKLRGCSNIRGFGNGIMRSPVCLPLNMMTNCSFNANIGSSKSILEVLSEVGADILALQDVKAVEENDMKPLSDLAKALGMNFVFAESWAPEYGNAILSKWPIKKWKSQKIVDDDDFRNVLSATIDVPWAGEVNFHCTQLDHLDENWRMKQMTAIISSIDDPHILAGGLNSLDASDYSWQRWADIVKYYEEIGKPTPKTLVMKFLKSKEYADAKDYAGECEPVVIIAKGQNVQGTCKYGTRVDYLLSSSDAPYKFVPGSYTVISSKGTSDHHVVKVDMVKLREKPLLARELSFNQNNKGAVRVASSCSLQEAFGSSTTPPDHLCNMASFCTS